jgi:peroxiredoxin
VELQENYLKIRDRGAEVVAIVVASLEAVEGLCESAQVPFPVLSDVDHEVAEAYAVYNLLGDELAAPAVFIVGAERRIVWNQIGRPTRVAVPIATILENLP